MLPNAHRKMRVANRMVADEPAWLRFLLILLTCGIIGWFIVVPMIYIFQQAVAEGIVPFWQEVFENEDSRAAIGLTLFVAPLSVLLNTVFGVTAAWLLTRFPFPGRTFLLTLLDLPFAISPVAAGLMIVLIFGRESFLGQTLAAGGIKILFAWPAIVIATTFVTLPFVARELIPLMQALGPDEELAAVSLGANPWQLFWRITLPNIKWGLLFGVIQCNARAIGEFGAVNVVSGKILGETDTLPIRVEKLFQDGKMSGAFALAALLTLMALVTLLGKLLLERMTAAELKPESVPVTAQKGDS